MKTIKIEMVAATPDEMSELLDEIKQALLLRYERCGTEKLNVRTEGEYAE